MWTYSQKTGILTDDSSRTYQCYAGWGDGKNNSADEAIKDVGPLPRGTYSALAPASSARTGPYTIRLIPDPENDMHGRAGMCMHGDSVAHPGCASEGCIVAPLAARIAFYESHQKLQVTE